MKKSVVVCLLGALIICPAVGFAQDADGSSPGSQDTDASVSAPFDIESLNLQGSDTSQPKFKDTVLGADSAFRRATSSHGFIYREALITNFAHNLLDNPDPSTEEVYVGERPYFKVGSGPLVTWDMRQLHLKNAQLNVGGSLIWVSWNRAGPKAAAFSDLYIYKSFANDRVEMKVGYLRNDFEFVGLKVGGSATSGAQGVYAVLPFEVGMSHFPVMTPSFNLKFNNPRGFYERVSFQRSTDPGGGAASLSRNATGLRFIPHGDKLLTVFEAGYKQDAEEGIHQTFVRGGTMYNTTGYANSRTGGMSSGNYCSYLLADHQFIRNDGNDPAHGVYAGASAMVAPADLNVYTQYYELRFYDKAPFRSRPKDMASLVASHSVYSRDTIRNLVEQGQTVWHNSNAVTGSYSFLVTRGMITTVGMGYVAGAAVTPRVPEALSLQLGTSFFF